MFGLEEPIPSWSVGGGDLLCFLIFLLVEFIYACIPKISFPCSLEVPNKFVWLAVVVLKVILMIHMLWPRPRPSQTISIFYK
jgi:hypothetical protein